MGVYRSFRGKDSAGGHGANGKCITHQIVGWCGPQASSSHRDTAGFLAKFLPNSKWGLAFSPLFALCRALCQPWPILLCSPLLCPLRPPYPILLFSTSSQPHASVFCPFIGEVGSIMVPYRHPLADVASCLRTHVQRVHPTDTIRFAQLHPITCVGQRENPMV